MSEFSSLTVGGAPILPGGLPVLAPGAKVFYLDPTHGSDEWPGTAAKPFKSLATAYAALRSGYGDTLILTGGPDSADSTGHTVRLTAAFDWAKDYTVLIGAASPVPMNTRSRITGPSTGGTFSPLFTVSADGCSFYNIAWYDDYTVDPVCLHVTGDRNAFIGCSIMGMAAATGADDAAAASLKLTDGDENRFYGCRIGLDTVPRSAANAEVLFASQCQRNVFEKCLFTAYCDSATHLFVSAPASSLDRGTYFIDCVFHNCVESSGLAMTQAMNIDNSAGGDVLLVRCSAIGCTDWAAADNGNVYIDGAAPTAGTSGLAVAVTR